MSRTKKKNKRLTAKYGVKPVKEHKIEQKLGRLEMNYYLVKFNAREEVDEEI